MADFMHNFVKKDLKNVKIIRKGKVFKLRPFETKAVNLFFKNFNLFLI